MKKSLAAFLTGQKHFTPEIEKFLGAETKRTGLDREKIIGVALVLAKKKLKPVKAAGPKAGPIGAFSETLLIEYEQKAALKGLLKALRDADIPHSPRA